MIIENPEALKVWLTRTLEPICDADPAALAKYVMALVKKDRIEKELMEICMDQLDVFLQKDTKSFVETLFDTLKTKNYILPEKPSYSVQPTVVVSSQSNSKSELKNIKADVNITEEKEDDRDSKRTNRHTRSHSRSPNIHHSRSRSRSGSRSRDRDDRRRRYTEDERRRRDFDHRNRRHDTRHEERSYRSHERDRERSRENDRPRSREKDREGSRVLDVKGRSRPDSQLISETKSTSPVRTQPIQDHGDTDYRLGQQPVNDISSAPATTISINSSISVVNQNSPVDSSYNNQSSFSNSSTAKNRCRDYDEKGYCMRGDLCIYDHGADPVIVEDVNLPNVLGFTPQGNSTNLPSNRPPISSLNQTAAIQRPPPPPPPRPPAPPLPPPPPLPPVESYVPEPYNPEAPSMNMPPRLPYWIGPRAPAPKPIPAYHQPRTRELRALPIDNSSNHNNSLQIHPVNSQLNSRTVIESRKQLAENIASNQAPYPQYNTFQPQNNVSQPKKARFDYNNQGGHFRKQFSSENCTLEIRKIPRALNNIAKLNEHFSKFGTIVNLQVCFEGDPEAALVQFSTHVEANSAYRSSEAVFNNRFIKVFWHNKNKQEQPAVQRNNQLTQSSAPASKKTIKDRLGGPLLKVNHIVNNLPEVTPSEDSIEKTVYTSSGGLSKTVFNPLALKSNKSKPAVATLSAAQRIVQIQEVRKKQEEQRKQAIKLKRDLRKKQQDLMKKQLQQNKLLIEKLEKGKNTSSDDKMNLLKNLHKLHENMETYRKEMKSVVPGHSTPKTSHEAQKEILDAELEIINKQNMGADTTELKKKVAELKQEASALGLLDSGRGRGRGRGRARFVRGLSRLALRGRPTGRRLSNSITIDRRTRQIKVIGFAENEKDELLLHFVQFGEVENIQHENKAAIITFKKRREAEIAAVKGAKFKGKQLVMGWYKPPIPSETSEEGHPVEEEGDPVEEEVSEAVDEDLLLGDEEEEEEDSEARSWRR